LTASAWGLVAGSANTVWLETPDTGNTLIVAGVVNGHNIWRTDLPCCARY
jgi:hypothetical protein